jgi:hypothetical protein
MPKTNAYIQPAAVFEAKYAEFDALIFFCKRIKRLPYVAENAVKMCALND